MSIAKHIRVALIASSKRPKVIVQRRKDKTATEMSGTRGFAPLVSPILVSPQKMRVLIPVMKITPIKMKNPPMSYAK